MIEALQAMGSVILDPYLVFLILITTILGVVIGVLPGLGATTGAALLLPFTLTMEPVHAIAVLATIYVSATFAGSITAILINTPGTAAAAAWCRKVGGKLENWRKLLIVKHSERRCAAAERSLRHETSYGIDVAQSIFR